MLVNFCPDDIFWTADHFPTKLGVIMQHHKPECQAEKLVHCLQCQGHSKGFYGKTRLLHSRSRSQQKFKMSVSLCPDDIFWTAEHFVTKLGMVMQHHEPECYAEKNCLLCSLSRSLWGLIWSKYDFLYVFWTADPFGTKLGLIELLWCGQSQGHKRGSEFQWLSIWTVPIQLLNLV